MHYEKYVDGHLNKVKQEVSEPNKTLIIDFVAQCRAENLSTARILEYLRSLRIIEKILDKSFKEATKNDLVRVVNVLQERRYKQRGYVGKKPRFVKEKYSESYILGFKITLKKFYKWVNGGEDYPEQVRWIKCTQKGGPKVEKNDILTEKEIVDIINACNRLRDRCFIHLTYETGARAGEIIDLKREDVEFTNDGAIIALTNEKYNKGKKRHMPIVHSVPDLISYLNHMSNKDDQAKLWVCEGRKNNGNRMTMGALISVFKKAAKKAGIERRCWLHLLRHSRCTHVSHLLTDAVKREMFNWSEKSNMPGHYTHISSKQVHDSILEKVYGIRNGINDNTFCPRCQARQLDINEERCWKCNQLLSEVQITEQINLKQELEQLKGFREKLELLIEQAVERKIEERGLVRVGK